MANSNVVQNGQDQGAGDLKALFLETVSEFAQKFFDDNTIMMDKVTVYNITNSDSFTIPGMGRTSVGYLTPGEELLGQTDLVFGKRTIDIDPEIGGHYFFSNINQAMSSWDVPKKVGSDLGYQIAVYFDTSAMKEVIKAANEGAYLGRPAGTVINNIDNLDSAVIADKVAAAQEMVFAVSETFDNNSIVGEKYLAVSNSIYNAILRNFDLFSSLVGGAASMKDGKIDKILDLNVVKSNLIPTDDTSVSDVYHGVDATDTVAIAFTKDTVAHTKLLPISSELVPQPEKRGDLLIVGMTGGLGLVSQETAIQVKLKPVV